MSTLIESLRTTSKAAPLFSVVMESAADELERKQNKIDILTEALREIEKRGSNVIATAALIKTGE